MPAREQANLPYRSPVTAPSKSVAKPRDEQQYDSLKEAQELLSESIKDLYKDFNAFDVLKTDNPQIAENFIREVAGKQEAYNILMPILQSLNSIVDKIEKKVV